jgi:D-beta-D-heptose 7-phosphate kinase/D-beta-D-heptose 1-phosphate adenosyltransferase
VACLEEAARLGDILVVAINSDLSVRRLKGADRPLVGQEFRAALLASLACVTHVLIFDEETPAQLLESLRPEALVKGGSTAEVVGRDVVERYGGRVYITPRVDSISTSSLLEKIRRGT